MYIYTYIDAYMHMCIHVCICVSLCDFFLRRTSDKHVSPLNFVPGEEERVH